MKKQALPAGEERKLKFAEAGILFVIVLAVTIVVGIRMAGPGADTDAAVPVASTLSAVSTVEEATPADIEPTPLEVVADTGGIADTAATEVEPAADIEPAATPRRVTYATAEEIYFSGDYAAAVDAFGAYVAEHPDNAWGHYMLGLSAWKADRDEDAAEAFTAALAISPDHVKSLVNSARVLVELDRTDEARERITAALQADPGNVEAIRVAGRIDHQAGLLEDAAADYLQALRVKSDDVWSLNNLGLVRIGQERFADALAPLAKAALLQPGMACVQNNLGVALERTGHYGAAAEAYAAAIDADAGYAKADLSLARVSGLTESADSEAVDLAALAAGFDAARATEVATAEADTVGREDTESGLAMLATLDGIPMDGDLPGDDDAEQGTDTDDPENDGPQDR